MQRTLLPWKLPWQTPCLEDIFQYNHNPVCILISRNSDSYDYMCWDGCIALRYIGDYTRNLGDYWNPIWTIKCPTTMTHERSNDKRLSPKMASRLDTKKQCSLSPKLATTEMCWFTHRKHSKTTGMCSWSQGHNQALWLWEATGDIQSTKKQQIPKLKPVKPWRFLLQRVLFSYPVLSHLLLVWCNHK